MDQNKHEKAQSEERYQVVVCTLYGVTLVVNYVFERRGLGKSRDRNPSSNLFPLPHNTWHFLLNKMHAPNHFLIHHLVVKEKPYYKRSSPRVSAMASESSNTKTPRRYYLPLVSSKYLG